ncbi:MAG: 5-amino-6-(D-ribitylamino)uracil--L-tyrosine 4-hydroxyphenyl transferase CofH [Candidatus Omnitrophica bacterium]|nr:5-amino-6-(D-ribitylamino)uracil--L-tyrosine 4-hydroxyphenyl transferase CofH [Candidatus Omnitrophota bacterium]
MWDTIEYKAKHSIDLTEEEAKWLLERQEPADLKRLYGLADEVNERLNGRVVSFIHNMNVNYTNICEYHCTFCEFKKSPTSKDAYILTFEDVKQRIDSADGELSEITFQGGLSSEVKFHEVLELLSKLREAYPQIHFHAFSPEEIDYYAWETNQSYLETVTQAKEAGMNSMCGTAAEVLDDEVRKKICWEKISSDEWCEIIKTAHHLGLPSTATILFGHIETSQHVMNHLKRVRDVQRETGGITEFIPLLFMPDKTKLGRVIDRSIDRVEYAFKMIAVSRLYFMNDIRNIQTSWVKLSWENALRSLSCGANDMSGTLYHENITREAGGENGEYTPREKFTSEIARIGKIPVERDTVYSYQKNQSTSLRESQHQFLPLDGGG